MRDSKVWSEPDGPRRNSELRDLLNPLILKTAIGMATKEHKERKEKGFMG